MDGDEFHLNSAFREIIMWLFFFYPNDLLYVEGG